MKILLLLLLPLLSAAGQEAEPASGASCPIGGGVFVVALACPSEAATALLPGRVPARVLRGKLDGFDATTVRSVLSRLARMPSDRFSFVHVGVQLSANGVRFRHATPSGDGFTLALSRRLMHRTTRVVLARLEAGVGAVPDSFELSRPDLLLARGRVGGLDVIVAIHALCEHVAYPDLLLEEQKRLIDDVRGIPRGAWVEGVTLASTPDSTAVTR